MIHQLPSTSYFTFLITINKYLFNKHLIQHLLLLSFFTCFSLQIQAQVCALEITPPLGAYDDVEKLGTNENGDIYLKIYHLEINRFELYITSGDSLKNITPTGGPWYNYKVLGKDGAGNFYFEVYPGSNFKKLFKHDGITMSDITPIESAWREIFGMGTDGNGHIYFNLNYLANGANVLYKYDGSTFSNETPISPSGRQWDMQKLGTAKNGNIYFSMHNGSFARELYQSDGTTLTNITPAGGPWETIRELGDNENGDIYFRITNNVDGDRQFQTDGITLTDITPTEDAWGVPNVIGADTNGYIYFQMYINFTDQKLFKSKGTTMTDITPIGGPWKTISALYNDQNGRIYFKFNTDNNGEKIYKYDGTTISDITPAASFPDRTSFQKLGIGGDGAIYFRRNNIFDGSKVYKYNGNTLNDISAIFGEINDQTSISGLGTDGNGAIYWETAQDFADGHKIMKYDGTILSNVTPTGGPWNYIFGDDDTAGIVNGNTDGNGNIYFLLNNNTNNSKDMKIYKFIPDNLCGANNPYNCSENQINLGNENLNLSNYSAKEVLISESSITTSSEVTFTAGDSIILKIGFEVKSGATFLAKIEDCSTTLLPSESVTSIQLNNTSVALAQTTLSLYPNPSSWQTTISYTIPESGYTSLNVYNNTGHLLKSLANNQWLEKGNYRQIIATEILQSGFYYVVLRTGDIVTTKKLIISK